MCCAMRTPAVHRAVDCQTLANFLTPSSVARQFAAAPMRILARWIEDARPCTNNAHYAPSSGDNDAPYRSGPSKTWLKSKNPLSEVVRRPHENAGLFSTRDDPLPNQLSPKDCGPAKSPRPRPDP